MAVSKYYVDVDICGDGDNNAVIESTRKEVEADGITLRLNRGGFYGPAGGNPHVRLYCDTREPLDKFLKLNGYDLDAHEVNEPLKKNREVMRSKARTRRAMGR